MPLARRARKWALDLAAPPPAPVAAADVVVAVVAVAVAAIVVLGVDVEAWRGVAAAADDGLLTARGMSAVGGFIDTGLRVRCHQPKGTTVSKWGEATWALVGGRTRAEALRSWRAGGSGLR